MMGAHSSESRHWAAALLHPLTLASWGVLVFNDHWLKHAHPGWLSGKLSDVAFMILAPLWLQAAWLLACSHGPGLGRLPEVAPTSRTSARWSLGVSMAVVGGTLILMETTRWGDAAYRFGLGGLQYPFRAFLALTRGMTAPSVRPVAATPDLTDLLCLPALAAAWWIGTADHRRSKPEARALSSVSETKTRESC
jgi:hypothetical protein